MRAFPYLSRAAPPVVPPPTVDRWITPPSQPMRRSPAFTVAVVAACISTCPFVPAPTVDKWVTQQPTPVRVHKATPYAWPTCTNVITATLTPANELHWLGTTTDWHTATNWSTTPGGPANGWVPTASDNVFFDANVTGYTLTADAVCRDYTATVPFAGTNSVATFKIAIGRHLTSDATCTITFLNTTSSTLAGNLSLTGTTALTGSPGKLTLTSTAGTINGVSAASVTVTRAIPVGAAYTVSGFIFSLGTWDVAGKLTIAEEASGTFVCRSTGEVDGAEGGASYSAGNLCEAGGLFHPNYLKVMNFVGAAVASLTGGTWDCPVYINPSSSSSARTWTCSGTNVFTQSVTVTKAGTGSFTVVNTNNPNFTLQGDLIWSVTGGSIGWTKGTGTITLSGSADQAVDFYNLTIEDLVVDKPGGRVTFGNSFTTDSFVFDDGDVDVNGYVVTVAGALDVNGGSGLARFWDGASADMSNGQIVVGGNLTMDGAAGFQLLITNLDFVANGGLATTTCATVTNSQNTGSINIDATGVGNVDNGGGNTGWNFGQVPSVDKWVVQQPEPVRRPKSASWRYQDRTDVVFAALPAPTVTTWIAQQPGPVTRPHATPHLYPTRGEIYVAWLPIPTIDKWLAKSADPVPAKHATPQLYQDRGDPLRVLIPTINKWNAKPADPTPANRAKPWQWQDRSGMPFVLPPAIIYPAEHIHNIFGTQNYNHPLPGQSQKIYKLTGLTSRLIGLPGSREEPYTLPGTIQDPLTLQKTE